MKKILAVAAAVAAALCFTACNGDRAREPYDELNDMLHHDYSSVQITVVNTYDGGVSLTGVYGIVYTEEGATVSYTVERFAEVSLGGASDGAVVSYTGAAEIKDGAVTVVSGDDVGLSADILERGITFRAEYFENAEFTGMSLRADVKDPSGFLGAETVCTGMKVEVTFLRTLLEMTVVYTDGIGSQVQIQYTFNN